MVAFAAFLKGGGKAVRTWVRNQLGDNIQRALMTTLDNLWGQAFDLGVQQARIYTGPVNIDPMDKRAMLNELARQWARQIAETRIAKITMILIGGGDAQKMADAIDKVMSSAAAAALIARTEITRAMSAGATYAYGKAGVNRVRWVTSGDNQVCPACYTNEAAGPQLLGKPFPSGAFQPPQHPRCRCRLVPA